MDKKIWIYIFHGNKLRIVYNDETSCFGELLKRDKSVKIHTRNLQSLATKLYKIKNSISYNIVATTNTTYERQTISVKK